MSMDFLRGFLYWLARILSNINAIRRGTMGQCSGFSLALPVDWSKRGLR
jgi:hypothetical protein